MNFAESLKKQNELQRKKELKENQGLRYFDLSSAEYAKTMLWEIKKQCQYNVSSRCLEGYTIGLQSQYDTACYFKVLKYKKLDKKARIALTADVSDSRGLVLIKSKEFAQNVQKILKNLLIESGFEKFVLDIIPNQTICQMKELSLFDEFFHSIKYDKQTKKLWQQVKHVMCFI